MDWLMDSPNDLETLLTNIEEDQLAYKYPGLSCLSSDASHPSFMLPLAPVHVSTVIEVLKHFTFTPLQILKRLPRESLERIPNIASILQKLFREVAVGSRHSQYCHSFLFHNLFSSIHNFLSFFFHSGS